MRKPVALRLIEGDEPLRNLVGRHRIEEVKLIATFHRTLDGRRIQQVPNHHVDTARYGGRSIAHEQPNVGVSTQSFPNDSRTHESRTADNEDLQG